MVLSLISSLLSNLLSGNGNVNQSPKTYLSYNNGAEKIQLPVPLSSFEINVKQNNSTVNINNLGELNMIGKTGLITLSLSSFFPNQQYSFCQCTPSSPYTYIKQIDTWRTSGKPIRVTVSDTPINYAVTIDNFKWSEKDGTCDVYFTLDLKEYKFLTTSADDTNSKTGLKNRKDESLSSKVAKNITYYPGDNLMNVASRALGANLNLGTNTNYLSLYKALSKRGGLNVGDVLKVTGTNSIKVGNLNVKL